MIHIIADTTCGFPLQLLSDLGIDVIPQIISFGDESYKDDFEIDSQTFLKKLKSFATLPKTSAPPPILYQPLFSKYVQAGDTVLVITPSSDVSGTFRSASMAAEEFPGADIHIFDSRTVAGGLGSLVLQAQTWVKEDMPLEILLSNLADMASHEKVFFVVDTLEYLHKGGRIGTAKALLGSLLQVKPILTVKDGHVDQFDKQRTSKQAINSILKLIVDYSKNSRNPHVTISHISAEKTALEIQKNLANSLGIENIPILLLPPAIVVHSGPGTISVSCFTK
jgi:DegV family protein with EDD domain